MKKSILSVIAALVLILFVQIAVPAGLHAWKCEEFYGFFGPKPEWETKDPKCTNFEASGFKLMNAESTYTKDEAEITAMIMIGSTAVTGAFLAQGEMYFESSEGKVATKEIDGFMVHTTYDKKANAGAVRVNLLPGKEEGGFFLVFFENLSYKEGLDFAKGFPWDDMKKKIESLD